MVKNISKYLIIKSLKKDSQCKGEPIYMDRFAPCTGRMLHQSYSLAVRLDTAVYVKRSPLLFR